MSTPSSDNVTLRIIILANGENRENDLYLVTGLDTKVGELKERLQQNLSQRPLPASQRLIYSGRPLLDNDARLRSILRLQSNSIETAPVHVVHLVIRQDEMGTIPNPASRSYATQAGSTLPQTSNLSTNQLRNHFHGHNSNSLSTGLPANGDRGIGPAQMHAMVQNQVMAMQQHLAAHNQHLSNAHSRTGPTSFGNVAHFPGLHHPPAQGPAANAQTAQTQSNGGTAGDPRQNTQGNMALASHPTSTVQGGMTTRIHETIGPNGERVRIVTNTSNPARPSTPLTGSVQQFTSVPGNALPSHEANVTHQQQNQSMPAIFPHPPSVPHPFPANLTLPFPTPFGFQAAVAQPPPPLQQQSANPMVWLLSSPSGPQGLLFAPGHGFFSSIASQQVRQTTGLRSATPAETSQADRPTSANPVPHQQRTGNDAGNVENAQLVVHPHVDNAPVEQAQVQAQAQAQPQNREGEDLLALVLQRGWLFIRLYMFIFVLSEPSTWRRWVLLSIAIFVCLLPRQNPLTDAFNAARRHVDNLIGPPQVPQRQPTEQRQGAAGAIAGPADGQAGNTGAAAGQASNQTGTRNQTMLTPEENARRLLREHRERNPSFIRGILQPIEQALALFLASLIPGVGERHVRAREEARQILAEEFERRRREAEEAAATSGNQQQSHSTAEESARDESTVDRSDESKGQETAPAALTDTDTAAGRSTGIDTAAASSSGPTLRTTNAGSPDAGSSS